MSEKTVRKQIRMSQELSDELDCEAKDAGVPVATYVLTLINERHNRATPAEENVDLTGVAAAVLATETHPTFGSETKLERIDRRTAQITALLMQLINASFDSDAVDGMLKQALSQGPIQSDKAN